MPFDPVRVGYTRRQQTTLPGSRWLVVKLFPVASLRLPPATIGQASSLPCIYHSYGCAGVPPGVLPLFLVKTAIFGELLHFSIKITGFFLLYQGGG